MCHWWMLLMLVALMGCGWWWHFSLDPNADSSLVQIRFETKSVSNQVRLNRIKPKTRVQVSPVPAPPPCRQHARCSLDRQQGRCSFFRNQDYGRGKWLPALDTRTMASKDPRPWLRDHAYAYQEACDQRTFEAHIQGTTGCQAPGKLRNLLQYQWFPDACSLLPWDPSSFSRHLLPGRVILFMGDSLMRQMFNSMRFLLQEEWLDPWEALHNRLGNEVFHTRDNVTLIFEWSKYFVDERVFRREHRLWLNGTAGWPRRIREEQVDVVVMNVGHHWQRLDPEFKLYLPMVSMVTKYLKKHFKGDLVVFRTSSLGHYHCDTDPKLKRPLEKHDLYDPETDTFNWRKPGIWELEWKTAMRDHGLSDKFVYLNVSNAGLRPDGLVEWKQRSYGKVNDCLHWCLPGIPGTYNVIVFSAYHSCIL